MKVDALRKASRKLVRELGIIQLDKSLVGPTPQHCHAFVEIGMRPGISVSELAQSLVLSVSAASRLVSVMQERGFIEVADSHDKREKALFLSSKGKEELKNIDEYSNAKVLGAFEFLSSADQDEIIRAIEKYSAALEKSRAMSSHVKIRTLSTSRPLRRQLMAMIEDIQKNEFLIPIDPSINDCILRAEDEFYFNNSYNFWYAVDSHGAVIGCIGLKKIDKTRAELKKFFVKKQFRGKGVSQKLVQTLLKACSKHGFAKLYLGTVKKLEAAQAFYAKSGFKRISEKELPKGFQKCHVDTEFFEGDVSSLFEQK